MKQRKRCLNLKEKRFNLWTDEDRRLWGKKMSEKNKGYKWSDQAKEKMKDNKNGAKYTIEEVREIRRLY